MTTSGELGIPDFVVQPFGTIFMRPASPFIAGNVPMQGADAVVAILVEVKT